MIVLTFVFGYLAKLPSEGVPYPVLTFAALVPWQFFATGFVQTSGALVGNGHMIQKVYFPRLILPLASMAVATLDFLVSFVFLLVLMAAFGIYPTIRVIAIPFFALLSITFTLGLGMWFATLFVKYRDVRHFIQFIVQLGLYVSPVAFSSSIVPEQWRTLYMLNPMASVIDGFRWALLGTAMPPPAGIASASVLSVVLLVSGTIYLRTAERGFADVI
jgi:lipopolysaccharide transport system permease protein